MPPTLEPPDDSDFDQKPLVDISSLPMEKQFSLHSFEKEVDKMTTAQLRYFLKAQTRQEALKLHVLKDVIKRDGL